MILGHANPEVVASLQEAIPRGTSYGAPTLLETELAKKIQAFMPSMEMIRLVSSGTEATMSALRVARGYTGRDRIVKFVGCYHGHSDSLLVKAGSGLATFGVPDSPGVPKGVAENTITLPYNDIDAVKQLFDEMGDTIACIIVEPVAGNMGCVPPVEGFLETLRDVTKAHGALLIFDEVMCGFRASSGGAQKLYNIKPDLTCLGKIVGGGMPLAVFGGSSKILSEVAPSGPIYQAGTLSGNGLEELAKKYNVPAVVQRVGSMFTLFFTDKPVHNFDDASACNADHFKTFFHHNLSHGIYYAPSPFESNFVSMCHKGAEIDKTLAVAEEAFKIISETL